MPHMRQHTLILSLRHVERQVDATVFTVTQHLLHHKAPHLCRLLQSTPNGILRDTSVPNHVRRTCDPISKPASHPHLDLHQKPIKQRQQVVLRDDVIGDAGGQGTR